MHLSDYFKCTSKGVEIFGMPITWYGIFYCISLEYLWCHVKRAVLGKKSSFKSGQKFLSGNGTFLVFFLTIFGSKVAEWLNSKKPHTLQSLVAHLLDRSSGLAFFGGAIGALVALCLISRQLKVDLKRLSDLYLYPLPVALGLGRIGNYLNGEVFGRPTDASWGEYFSSAPDAGSLLRHPSQLYEAVLEGPLLGFLLWRSKRKKKGNSPGSLTASFLLYYGLFRALAECYREPERTIELFDIRVTYWQISSALMVVSGLLLGNQVGKKRKKNQKDLLENIIRGLSHESIP